MKAQRKTRQDAASVVVVGNGMVSHRFCERLAELDAEGRFRIVVIGEEPQAAYDRVHLTSYFSSSNANALSLGGREWYEERDITLRLGERVERLDASTKTLATNTGASLAYDALVLATGSRPFVPPLPGADKRGVFVYRTLEDLDAIREYAQGSRCAAVIGGGLLGLEAAKAALDLGLSTHVVEFAPRLMPRQLDPAGARLLAQKVGELGVQVHLDARTQAIAGGERVESLELEGAEPLPVDMVIVSAGIRPRDELAGEAGIALHPRGGILVDDQLHTSADAVYAIGECASHRDRVYGLVGPGYAMAEALAQRLSGAEGHFEGADQSTKLKLLGVEVASFGDPFRDGARSVSFEDTTQGIYKRLALSEDGARIVGGILVGDASRYTALAGLAASGEPLPLAPEELLMGSPSSVLPMTESTAVCTCNNVTAGDVRAALCGGSGDLADVKRATRAGTGCGGCLPTLQDLVARELTAAGREVSQRLCEHFAQSRTELYEIVAATGIRSFGELIASHGSGLGCEICKPTVASILASTHGELIAHHDTIQDTNDRFLANIQRGGLYSVVPRIPGGEITPDRLIAIGEVAKEFALYTKITGGQRIDLFGARLEQLPEIWERLIGAGFESGHAYGKSMRTVKSCVGSTWCRYGVQDSVGFAIRVENRYKGLRAPHKLKSAVSGCTRECAEARSKDFGLIATEKGYALYVCGNGGMSPRHAELLATDLDEAAALRLIDRFLIFYIRTADRLTRTAKWLDQLPGGLEHLKDVVVHDSLGICRDLEQQMQRLVDSYQCEWNAVVKSPELRRKFERLEADDGLRFVDERGQKRPADWPTLPPESQAPARHLPVVSSEWVEVASASDFSGDGGRTFSFGQHHLAVFHFAGRDEWFASQARCPHRGDVVLGRGIVGDDQGEPKVACPQHKKSFSLRDGRCLGSDCGGLEIYPVRVVGEAVLVELPIVEAQRGEAPPPRTPSRPTSSPTGGVEMPPAGLSVAHDSPDRHGLP